MKDITTEEAVEMLNKFITEHKLYNIKQSDGLEQNIEKVLNELNSKKGTINALKIALKERTDERDKKDEIINKKDKIIKNQSYTNKKMRKKLDGYRKLLKLKERHLLKKDRIIDAMAEEIEKFGCISTEVFDSTTECINKENCKECIKQYFERKVKDE